MHRNWLMILAGIALLTLGTAPEAVAGKVVPYKKQFHISFRNSAEYTAETKYKADGYWLSACVSYPKNSCNGSTTMKITEIKVSYRKPNSFKDITACSKTINGDLDEAHVILNSNLTCKFELTFE